MRTHLVKSFSFDAAHCLPGAPDGHRCRNLHGHTYRVEVEVAGEVDPDIGWFMDYGDIKKVVKPLVKRLDHVYLNDIKGLELGTAELMAKWLWDGLEAQLPGLHRIGVFETPSSGCHYYGE